MESAGLGSESWFHLTGSETTRCHLTSLSLSFHPYEVTW